jgi:hypothetical protein
MTLSVLLLVAIGLFLYFPIDSLSPPAWLMAIQSAARAGLGQLWTFVPAWPVVAPFLVVIGLGATIGLVEATATFADYPREVLRSNWVKILVLLNAFVSAIVFGVVWSYSAETDPYILALTVGLGFQTLIRTKFTLAKQFGGEGKDSEVSVNFGWLYDQFQNFCKTRIDLDLMEKHQDEVVNLANRYSMDELYGIADYIIEARTTLTQEQKQARRVALEKFITDSPSAPASALKSFVGMKIALFILQAGGQDDIAIMTSRPESVAAAPVEHVPAPISAIPATSPAPSLASRVGKLFQSAVTALESAQAKSTNQAIEMLLRRFPTTLELSRFAEQVIDVQASLKPEEKEQRRQQLREITGGGTSSDGVWATLALFILNIGGNDVINMLPAPTDLGSEPVLVPSPQPSNDAGAKPLSDEDVVKQLIERFSLNELVAFVKKLKPDADWIDEYSRHDPSVAEDSQKTAIGYRLLKELGIDQVRAALKEHETGDVAPATPPP